jgi:pimeloyl-ACP methyl ester carboxylesterase
MTSFCLVHGAWHDDACWAPLVGELEHRGHECVTPVLPLERLDATFEDYADVVVEALAGIAAPVVVGHSMSSAVVPLVPAKRKVARLVYLCPAMAGFPEPPGEPAYRREGYEGPPKNADGSTYWPRDRAVGQLYAHLDRDTAEHLAARLRPQPVAPFRAQYPLQRPPDVPSTFIYSLDDELFDERWSRWICQELLGIEPIELPGGHFPMLERPAVLADLLESL